MTASLSHRETLKREKIRELITKIDAIILQLEKIYDYNTKVYQGVKIGSYGSTEVDRFLSEVSIRTRLILNESKDAKRKLEDILDNE